MKALGILFLFAMATIASSQYKLPKAGGPERVISPPESTSERRDQQKAGSDAIQLENDARPSPDTPEGKARLRQMTQDRLIHGDTRVLSGATEIVLEFSRALTLRDENALSSVVRFQRVQTQTAAAGRRALTARTVMDDYTSAGIDISKFSFGVHQINTDSTVAIIIMMNEDGIETGQLVLERTNKTPWAITGMRR